MRRLVLIAVLAAGCGSIGDTPLEPDAAPGTCDDGEQNGDETDVDCGGACPVCGIGRSCDTGNDCDTKACAAGVCLTPTSCRVIADSEVTTSGVYSLELDGVVFDAFCDMETDGGGWALIMKATSGGVDLVFDSPLWTNEDLLAADNLEPNIETAGVDAKFIAYSKISGTELRLEFNSPNHDINFGPFPLQSALALFSAPENPVIELDAGCNGPALVETTSYDGTIMRHGQGHQFFGVNGEDRANGNNGRLRFGYGSNDEGNSPWRARQAIGGRDNSLVWISHSDCDGCGGCYGVPFDPPETSANLWIR